MKSSSASISARCWASNSSRPCARPFGMDGWPLEQTSSEDNVETNGQVPIHPFGFVCCSFLLFFFLEKTPPKTLATQTPGLNHGFRWPGRWPPSMFHSLASGGLPRLSCFLGAFGGCLWSRCVGFGLKEPKGKAATWVAVHVFLFRFGGGGPHEHQLVSRT